MLRLTFIFASLLVLAGVIAYAVSGAASVTALIPAFVGLALLALGFIARNEGARKHALHVAMVVALLGLLGSLMNVAQIGEVFAGTAERPAAVITSTVMFVLLALYLVFGIRTFILARRSSADEVTSD